MKILSLFLFFLPMLLLSQTTNVTIRLNEISTYSEDHIQSRFTIPVGSEFIDWNSDCILIKIGTDFKTLDHFGRSLSKISSNNRKFIKMTNEIIIREDNNIVYYNSRFYLLRKIPSLF